MFTPQLGGIWKQPDICNQTKTFGITLQLDVSVEYSSTYLVRNNYIVELGTV